MTILQGAALVVSQPPSPSPSPLLIMTIINNFDWLRHLSATTSVATAVGGRGVGGGVAASKKQTWPQQAAIFHLYLSLKMAGMWEREGERERK